jgi:serine/threonine protein kinase
MVHPLQGRSLSFAQSGVHMSRRNNYLQDNSLLLGFFSSVHVWSSAVNAPTPDCTRNFAGRQLCRSRQVGTRNFSAAAFQASSPILPKQVDVWAVGVMLYQMLFGRRPFGEGCSQEEILRDEVMLKARQVIFPAKPAISAECKDFITRCARKARRPWC